MDLNLEQNPPKSHYNFDCVISCAFISWVLWRFPCIGLRAIELFSTSSGGGERIPYLWMFTQLKCKIPNHSG